MSALLGFELFFEWKKSACFSKRLYKIINNQKAQIYAFNLAKDTALKQLGDDAKEYIANNYGDLQEWLKTEIEASINKLKN